MKEDILEQLVDDYLQAKGYFTRHNVKFRPRHSHRHFDQRQDSSYSDIDVLGINPFKRGAARVVVVSCKSWQAGFSVDGKLEEITKNKRRSGRESWKFFRELTNPKWSQGFIDAIQREAGTKRFTYVTAVTSLRGDRRLWEKHQPFVNRCAGTQSGCSLYPRCARLCCAGSRRPLQDLTLAALSNSFVQPAYLCRALQSARMPNTLKRDLVKRAHEGGAVGPRCVPG